MKSVIVSTNGSAIALKPEGKHSLQRGEKLADGIRRILKQQLSFAITELSDEERPIDTAVHEARKAMKRTRSLLRLIRPAIKQSYSRENRELQSVGRTLSELRDAQALLETLEGLASSTDGSFASARDFLRKRKDALAEALQARGELRSAAEKLDQVLQRFDKLSLDDLDFAVPADAVQKSIKRGKRAFSRAVVDEDPERFHECRKRAKDLRYQLELLTEIWPGVLEAYAGSAKKLEEYLGDDHNLAVLREILDKAHVMNGEREILEGSIESKQAKLREKARQLSRRLYSEPPDAWSRRLRSSWRAWNAENKVKALAGC